MKINWRIYTSLGLQTFLRNLFLSFTLVLLFLVEAGGAALLIWGGIVLYSLLRWEIWLGILFTLILADLLLLQVQQRTSSSSKAPPRSILIVMGRVLATLIALGLLFPYIIWQRFVFWRGKSRELATLILEYLHLQKEPQAVSEIIKALWEAQVTENPSASKDDIEKGRILEELLPPLSRALENLERLRLVRVLAPAGEEGQLFFALTPHAQELFFPKEAEEESSSSSTQRPGTPQ